MKCNCCSALIDCSNEDVGYETACWYGDSYQDENCIEYKDGSCGCNKTREEIEADMKRANDYLASEEYRAEQVLGHSKNFELVYSSVIEHGDKDGPNQTILSFSFLDKIKFYVTISKPCEVYPKMINVKAIKDGYCIDNFKVATNDVAEAAAKIIECAENRNE